MFGMGCSQGLRFSRWFNEWGLEEVVNAFFGRLRDYSVSSGVDYVMVWKKTKNNVFFCRY